jgi:hypothetical protein
VKVRLPTASQCGCASREDFQHLRPSHAPQRRQSREQLYHSGLSPSPTPPDPRQALQGKDITIYGNGEQTRSFQFVDDLVSGLVALMAHDYTLPVNIGNPDEYTVKVPFPPPACFSSHHWKDFAYLIRDLTHSDSEIIFLPATQDDPRKRKPDITVAKEQLGWSPQVDVKSGVLKTINYFRLVRSLSSPLMGLTCRRSLRSPERLSPPGRKPCDPTATRHPLEGNLVAEVYGVEVSCAHQQANDHHPTLAYPPTD